jgi:hypothetical protein
MQASQSLDVLGLHGLCARLVGLVGDLSTWSVVEQCGRWLGLSSSVGSVFCVCVTFENEITLVVTGLPFFSGMSVSVSRGPTTAVKQFRPVGGPPWRLGVVGCGSDVLGSKVRRSRSSAWRACAVRTLPPSVHTFLPNVSKLVDFVTY